MTPRKVDEQCLTKAIELRKYLPLLQKAIKKHGEMRDSKLDKLKRLDKLTKLKELLSRPQEYHLHMKTVLQVESFLQVLQKQIDPPTLITSTSVATADANNGPMSQKVSRDSVGKLNKIFSKWNNREIPEPRRRRSISPVPRSEEKYNSKDTSQQSHLTNKTATDLIAIKQNPSEDLKIVDPDSATNLNSSVQDKPLKPSVNKMPMFTGTKQDWPADPVAQTFQYVKDLRQKNRQQREQANPADKQWDPIGPQTPLQLEKDTLYNELANPNLGNDENEGLKMSGYPQRPRHTTPLSPPPFPPILPLGLPIPSPPMPPASLQPFIAQNDRQRNWFGNSNPRLGLLPDPPFPPFPSFSPLYPRGPRPNTTFQPQQPNYSRPQFQPKVSFSAEQSAVKRSSDHQSDSSRSYSGWNRSSSSSVQPSISEPRQPVNRTTNTNKHYDPKAAAVVPGSSYSPAKTYKEHKERKAQDERKRCEQIRQRQEERRVMEKVNRGLPKTSTGLYGSIAVPPGGVTRQYRIPKVTDDSDKTVAVKQSETRTKDLTSPKPANDSAKQLSDKTVVRDCDKVLPEKIATRDNDKVVREKPTVRESAKPSVSGETSKPKDSKRMSKEESRQMSLKKLQEIRARKKEQGTRSFLEELNSLDEPVKRRESRKSCDERKVPNEPDYEQGRRKSEGSIEQKAPETEKENEQLKGSKVTEKPKEIIEVKKKIDEKKSQEKHAVSHESNKSVNAEKVSSKRSTSTDERKSEGSLSSDRDRNGSKSTDYKKSERRLSIDDSKSAKTDKKRSKSDDVKKKSEKLEISKRHSKTSAIQKSDDHLMGDDVAEEKSSKPADKREHKTKTKGSESDSKEKWQEKEKKKSKIQNSLQDLVNFVIKETTSPEERVAPTTLPEKVETEKSQASVLAESEPPADIPPTATPADGSFALVLVEPQPPPTEETEPATHLPPLPSNPDEAWKMFTELQRKPNFQELIKEFYAVGNLSEKPTEVVPETPTEVAVEPSADEPPTINTEPSKKITKAKKKRNELQRLQEDIDQNISSVMSLQPTRSCREAAKAKLSPKSVETPNAPLLNACVRLRRLSNNSLANGVSKRGRNVARRGRRFVRRGDGCRTVAVINQDAYWTLPGAIFSTETAALALNDAADAENSQRLFKCQCRFCEMIMPCGEEEVLLQHASEHTGEDRWRCCYQDCTETSNTKENMESHVLDCHYDDEAPDPRYLEPASVNTCSRFLDGFLCGTCNFVQISKISIEFHVKATHTKADIHKIQIFKTLGQLDPSQSQLVLANHSHNVLQSLSLGIVSLSRYENGYDLICGKCPFALYETDLTNDDHVNAAIEHFERNHPGTHWDGYCSICSQFTDESPPSAAIRHLQLHNKEDFSVPVSVLDITSEKPGEDRSVDSEEEATIVYCSIQLHADARLHHNFPTEVSKGYLNVDHLSNEGTPQPKAKGSNVRVVARTMYKDMNEPEHVSRIDHTPVTEPPPPLIISKVYSLNTAGGKPPQKQLTEDGFRHFFKCMGVNCNYTTDNFQQFHTHIAVHEESGAADLNKSWRRCPYCPMKSDNNITTHISVAHKYCRFQCKRCFFRAAEVYYIMYHLSQKHNCHSPEYLTCGEKIPPRTKRKLHTMKLYECQCKLTFENTDEFTAHWNNMHEGNVCSCHICSDCFDDIFSLVEHYRSHGINNIDCGYCSFAALDSDRVKRHLAVEHPDKYILIIPRATSSQSSAKQIVATDNRSVRMSALLTENLLCRELVEVNQNDHGTNYAAESLRRDMQSLRARIHDETADLLEEKKPNLPLRTSPVTVTQSSKPQAVAERPAAPIVAPLLTLTESRVDEGIYGPNDIHLLPPGEFLKKDIQCSLCGYQNKVKRNIIRHLRSHEARENVPPHAATNPVPDTNDLMFNKMKNLANSSQADAEEVQRVLVEDTSRCPPQIEKLQRLKCDACGHLTNTVQLLYQHLFTLHPQNDFYSCPNCPETVPIEIRQIPLTPENISKHIKLHDKRLYKCPYCFHLESNLTQTEKHVTSQHPMKKLTVSTIREEAGKKMYFCRECHTRTLTSHEILAHLQCSHGLNGRYKCKECKFTFKYVDDMKSHWNQCHGGRKVEWITTYGTGFDEAPKSVTTVDVIKAADVARQKEGIRSVRNVPVSTPDKRFKALRCSLPKKKLKKS